MRKKAKVDWKKVRDQLQIIEDLVERQLSHKPKKVKGRK